MNGGTALVVIDMQRAYFEQEALAAVQERLVDNINELVVAARHAAHPVVMIHTEHARDRSTWTLNMLEDDQGFAFPGTDSVEPPEGLDTVGAIRLTKTRDSAFHGTRLREVLAQYGVAQVVLCGVSTHSCITQTATTGFADNFRVSVARDAVASEAPELSEAMLEFLSAEMRQPILDQEESVAALRGGPLAS